MPQLANLVINDRAATPVAHTFTPADIDQNGVASVEETTGGVPIGFNRITVAVNRTSGGRRKVTLKGSFPIVQTETINGISTPVVVRTGYFDCTFSFDGSSLEQERKDVVGFLAGVLDPSKWTNDVLTKLQSVY